MSFNAQGLYMGFKVTVFLLRPDFFEWWNASVARLRVDAIKLGYLENDQIWKSLQVWQIFLFVFVDHATELRISREKNAECLNTISAIKTEVCFIISFYMFKEFWDYLCHASEFFLKII